MWQHQIDKEREKERNWPDEVGLLCLQDPEADNFLTTEGRLLTRKLPYHISVLPLAHEPASVTEFGAVTEQYDISTAISDVSIR